MAPSSENHSRTQPKIIIAAPRTIWYGTVFNGDIIEMSWKVCERLLIPLTVVGHHAKQSTQLSRYSTVFCRKSALSSHIPGFPMTSSRILSSPVVVGDVDKSLFHHPHRRYSSGDRNSNDVQNTKVSGYIVHVPHPIRWLKTKVYEYILRARVEPSFNFSDFLVGSKQVRQVNQTEKVRNGPKSDRRPCFANSVNIL